MHDIHIISRTIRLTTSYAVNTCSSAVVLFNRTCSSCCCTSCHPFDISKITQIQVVTDGQVFIDAHRCSASAATCDYQHLLHSRSTVHAALCNTTQAALCNTKANQALPHSSKTRINTSFSCYRPPLTEMAMTHPSNTLQPFHAPTMHQLCSPVLVRQDIYHMWHLLINTPYHTAHGIKWHAAGSLM